MVDLSSVVLGVGVVLDSGVVEVVDLVVDSSLHVLQTFVVDNDECLHVIYPSRMRRCILVLVLEVAIAPEVVDAVEAVRWKRMGQDGGMVDENENVLSLLLSVIDG